MNSIFSWSVQCGIICHFLLSLSQVSESVASLETNIGGTYTSNYTLSVASSPYVATSDITISNGSTLTIEAGVQINFQARVKLHVRGTLVARGSPNNEIVMFHNMTVGVNSSSIRLVGGQNPREGRVEVFNDHGWETVCNDSWSFANALVVCRHLGFGHPIETSTLRFGQGSGNSSSSRVDCEGTENSLLDCGASNHSNTICPNSQHVGIVCGTVGIGYWGGIVFHPDDSEEYVFHSARKYRSDSVLENVEIISAGVIPETYFQRPDRRAAAITMKTSSPTITNVSITDVGYTGIDMDVLHSDVHFSGLTIENSSSSGIVGSYSWQFNCSFCRLSDTGNVGIDIRAILPLLDRPFSNGIPIRTSHLFADVLVAYRVRLYLKRPTQYRIVAPARHGLIVAFRHANLHGSRLTITDYTTGLTVFRATNSGYPDRIAIPSSHILMLLYGRSPASTLGIPVSVSSYPLSKTHHCTS
jgi:hypothetical protein